jgi:epoxyqueuosine reductase
LFWPEIGGLLELSDEDWSRMIRHTSMKRAKVKGLLRNLMVVVGNSGVREFVPKLQKFLAHSDAHVRSHAEWAMNKLKGS